MTSFNTCAWETTRLPTIALLLESDGPGGAEQMLLHLAESLRSRGHHVVPVGPIAGCGWLGSEFRNRGFEPETFHLRRPIDPGCVSGLAGLFRDRRIDLAHSHEFTMAVYGAAAARLTATPHLITMHGGMRWAGRWRRRAALRWAFRTSRGVVTVSHPARLVLSEVLGTRGRIEVVPNGVPCTLGDRQRIRKELAVSDDTALIVAVGNLYPVKDHATLVQAVATLPLGTPWRLAIAGRGEEEARLCGMAASLGVSDRVSLLGYRADVSDLLAAADIFAMPSLSEGLPLALLEAMFAGLAITASSVGGIPDAIRHETEGVLLPAGDPVALREVLYRLIMSPDLRHRLGSAARRRAFSEFSIERMTDQYQRIYFRFLESNGQSRSGGNA